MIMDAPDPLPSHDLARRAIRRRQGRRMVIGINVIASLLLSISCLVLLNLLASSRPFRVDLGRSGFYTLSDKSISLLQSIKDPVEVKIFYQRGQDVLRDIEALMDGYRYQAPLMQVEYIDPDRHLARAEELAARFGVKQPNVVIFHHKARTRIVSTEEILEYDFSAVRQGVAPARASFRGEQAFTSALLAITQERTPVVYFLTGHGERRPDNFDPFTGYSSIAKGLARDRIEVRMLNLGETQSVPADCDALIIAGPTRRIAQPELDLIGAYLDRSGRVLMMIDALKRTGLESLLLRWGVQLGDDIVVDPGRTITGREIFVTQYGFHPITERIQGLTSIFHLPRSVLPVQTPATGASAQADRPHATILATTSERGWAERAPDLAPMRFDPDVDMPGPVPIAVAVERGPVAGIDVQIRSSRLVVVGDSAFVSNGALTGGDEDFFMSALNWLLDRDLLMAIAPKSYEDARLLLDRDDLRRLFMLFVVALPGGTILLGLLVHVRRRK